MGGSLRAALLALVAALVFVSAQCGCAGKDTCGDCTGTSGCIWCIANSTYEGQRVCLRGNIEGAGKPYKLVTCDDFYFNQCKVNNHWAGNALSYVWMIVLLVFLIVLTIIGILIIISFTAKCCKKCCKDCAQCECCRCGKIIDDDNIKTSDKGGYKGDYEPNINDLAQGKTGPQVAKAPPTAAAPAAPRSSAPLVMPDDIDRSVLPPGFEPEPPAPVFVKGGTEDQYKEFMVTRLKYETWENQLLLYYRRNPDWAKAHMKQK